MSQFFVVGFFVYFLCLRVILRKKLTVFIHTYTVQLKLIGLKSLEIEEKINKIRWLKRANPAHFLLSTNGKRNGFLYV